MSQILVVVCGLGAEAKIIAAAGVTLVVGGGDQSRLAHNLDRIGPDARAILSMGIAGGLDPHLRPGDVRVAEAVVLPSGERLVADANWATAIARRLGVPLAVMAGADAPVSDVAGKTDLHRRAGAATVDMESHIAAAAASSHRRPFAAIRVVTDPAGRALPHAASVGMRPDGGVDLAAILRSLARHPAQVPDLIRTGLEARRAFAALFRCRQLLGTDFALGDLSEPRLHVT